MTDEEYRQRKAETELAKKKYDEAMRMLLETGQESTEIEVMGRTFTLKRDPDYLTKKEAEETEKEAIRQSPLGKKMAEAQKIANETGRTMYVQDGEGGMRFAVFPKKEKKA